MKLILREHVENLGDRGDVVNVARGYARNFLIPKGLAWEATAGYRRQLEQQRKAWDARDARSVRDAEALAARLGELRLEIARKSGETGTLYGSVTTSDVAGLLSAKGVEIDRRRLVLGEAIKSVGEFEIVAKLHPKVQAKIALRVVAEGAEG